MILNAHFGTHLDHARYLLFDNLRALALATCRLTLLTTLTTTLDALHLTIDTCRTFSLSGLVACRSLTHVVQFLAGQAR